jgi:hypothetical protein
MKAAFASWRVALLAAPLLMGAAAGFAVPPDVPSRVVVDVFPTQNWAELGVDSLASEPASPPELPDQIDPASFGGPTDPAADAAPLPFRLSGEWREDGKRILVLDGAPGLRLLCERRCTLRDALQPGGEIAPGYRFDSVGPDGVLIRTDDGATHTLPLPGLDP